MVATGRKLTAAVEEYLAELRRIRATGGGTGELSYYPPLNNLLNAVGGSLRPKVYCVSQLAQQGAGHPTSASMPPGRCRPGGPSRARRRRPVWWRSSLSATMPGSPPTAPRSAGTGGCTG